MTPKVDVRVVIAVSITIVSVLQVSNFERSELTFNLTFCLKGFRFV